MKRSICYAALGGGEYIEIKSLALVGRLAKSGRRPIMNCITAPSSFEDASIDAGPSPCQRTKKVQRRGEDAEAQAAACGSAAAAVTTASTTGVD